MQPGAGSFFDELERELRSSREHPRVPAAIALLAALRREFEADWRVRRLAELLAIRDELREAQRLNQRALPKTIVAKRPRGLPFPVRFEPAQIHAALEASSHNVANAAKALGCSRATVYEFKRKSSANCIGHT